MLPAAHPIFPQTMPGTVLPSDFPHLLFEYRPAAVLSAIAETPQERETRLAADRANPDLKTLSGPARDAVRLVNDNGEIRLAKTMHGLYAVAPSARFRTISAVSPRIIGEVVYLDDEAPNAVKERGLVFADDDCDVRIRFTRHGGRTSDEFLWANALDLLPLPWRYVIENGVWWTDVISSDLLIADTASLRARVESTRFANEGSTRTMVPGWYALKHDLGTLVRGQRVWLMHETDPQHQAEVAVLQADSAPLAFTVHAGSLLPVPSGDPSTEDLRRGTRERFLARTAQGAKADAAGGPETADEGDDVSSTVDALRERLESVMRRLAQAEERERLANEKIERIVEVAHREANERDWCSEFDEILDELGLPPREQTWEVEVVYTHRIKVTAAGEDAAREAAWEVARSVTDLVAARDLEDGVTFVEDRGIVDTEIASVEVA